MAESEALKKHKMDPGILDNEELHLKLLRSEVVNAKLAARIAKTIGV